MSSAGSWGWGKVADPDAARYLAMALPAVGLFGNVAVQIAWMRLFRSPSLLHSVYGGFFAGAAAVLALQAGAIGKGASGEHFTGDLAANLLIYGLLGYDYFHFINLGETGRRVRLVRELFEAPGGLTLEEIRLRYNASEMVRRRLGRLVRSGQVVLENGNYRIGSPVMASISRFIRAMKIMILGRASEFDA